MKKSIYILMALVLAKIGLTVVGQKSSALAQDAGLQPGDIVSLGKALFFDENLSVNGAQSCASCHAPEAGFTGPDVLVNEGGAVYQGALPNHFGNRKPPTSAYAGASPALHFNEQKGGWFGGMFWDGVEMIRPGSQENLNLVMYRDGQPWIYAVLV